MLAYKDAIESLYSHSVAEFTRRQDPTSTSHRRRDEETIQPLIRLDQESSFSDPTTGLEKLTKRLIELETGFKARVNALLGDLAHQPDTDMRFLAVVMNFNDVYRPVRRRRVGRDKDRVVAVPGHISAHASAAGGDGSGSGVQTPTRIDGEGEEDDGRK
jgi:gamma-tubulin complex component 3